MFRWLTVFLFGGAVGAAFGTALGFFLFPYVFPPPPAMDTLTAAEQGTLVAKGSFTQPNPNDPIHTGKGGVSVYSGTVFLEDDFEVGPGPDFHVYLVPAGVDLTKFPSVVIWCQQFSVLISPADLTFEQGT
jgi:hypothetical protein